MSVKIKYHLLEDNTEDYDNFKDYGATDMLPLFLYYLYRNFNYFF
jgi:hypothetical protein